VAFSGLSFLSFYLAEKMRLFDPPGFLWKTTVFFTPFVGAALIAISRVTDYRHHWSDVTVGAILGNFSK